MNIKETRSKLENAGYEIEKNTAQYGTRRMFATRGRERVWLHFGDQEKGGKMLIHAHIQKMEKNGNRATEYHAGKVFKSIIGCKVETVGYAALLVR